MARARARSLAENEKIFNKVIEKASNDLFKSGDLVDVKEDLSTSIQRKEGGKASILSWPPRPQSPLLKHSRTR